MIAVTVGHCTCITCLAKGEAERNLAKAQSEEQAIHNEIDRARCDLQQRDAYGKHASLRAHLETLRGKKSDSWVVIRRSKVALATAQLEVMRRHQPDRYSKARHL